MWLSFLLTEKLSYFILLRHWLFADKSSRHIMVEKETNESSVRIQRGRGRTAKGSWRKGTRRRGTGTHPFQIGLPRLPQNCGAGSSRDQNIV